jgi:hypothetical protein
MNGENLKDVVSYNRDLESFHFGFGIYNKTCRLHEMATD